MTKDPLQDAIEAIRKSYGATAISRLGDSTRANVEVFSSGSIALDRAVGGGIPKGRIIEIFGPESSGKTTLASHIIAEAQKLGGIAAFVDAEHAYDPIYSEKIGVDNKKLLFSQPETGEEALNIVDTLVRCGKVAVIVIDSVAALTPRAELDGEMGAANVGLQPRMMGQAMRKLAGIASRSGTTLVFLNQIRMKIGISYGNPETQPGGNALKFYASLRLDIRRGKKVDSDGDTVSSETRVKVVKNKVAPPFKIAEFNIRFGVGIDKIEEILTMGVECGEIEKAAAFFTINGEKFQGAEKARAYLESNPKVMETIRKKILSVDPVTGEVK